MITQKADGTTVPVQPGDTLHFKLKKDLAWKIVSIPHMTDLVTPPASGRFVLHVNRAGDGMVKALGTCPGCKDVQYTVDIKAYWIP